MSFVGVRIELKTVRLVAVGMCEGRDTVNIALNRAALV
jgi:hypothetical protein